MVTQAGGGRERNFTIDMLQRMIHRAVDCRYINHMHLYWRCLTIQAQVQMRPGNLQGQQQAEYQRQDPTAICEQGTHMFSIRLQRTRGCQTRRNANQVLFAGILAYGLPSLCH